MPLSSIPDPGGLCQVLRHQRIPQSVIEGRLHPLILHLHKVKQPRHVLGGLDRRLRVLPPLLHLVQRDEGGRADVVVLEELDALLGCVDSVYYDVVQRTAGSRDGDVVFLVDGAQVALRGYCGVCQCWGVVPFAKDKSVSNYQDFFLEVDPMKQDKTKSQANTAVY